MKIIKTIKILFVCLFFAYILLLVYIDLPIKKRYVGVYVKENKKLELNNDGRYIYWINNELICEGKWVAINKFKIGGGDSDIELQKFKKDKKSYTGFQYYTKTGDCLGSGLSEFPPEFCKEESN